MIPVRALAFAITLLAFGSFAAWVGLFLAGTVRDLCGAGDPQRACPADTWGSRLTAAAFGMILFGSALLAAAMCRIERAVGASRDS